jgi:hypothetical protein
MNIVYLDYKLLDITKRGFDFIEMSVFSQFLIDNICFVTFVSQIEGCGGLICHQRGLGCPLGCQNHRSGHSGSGGGRRCPLLPPLFYSNDCGGQFYSNEEQFPFLLLIFNQIL